MCVQHVAMTSEQQPPTSIICASKFTLLHVPARPGKARRKNGRVPLTQFLEYGPYGGLKANRTQYWSMSEQLRTTEVQLANTIQCICH